MQLLCHVIQFVFVTDILYLSGPELTKGPLADLELSDVLYHHMVGGPRSAVSDNLSVNKYNHQSFQVKEGDNINIDVTGPGSALALGMMYFDSGEFNYYFEWY